MRGLKDAFARAKLDVGTSSSASTHEGFKIFSSRATAEGVKPVTLKGINAAPKWDLSDVYSGGRCAPHEHMSTSTRANVNRVARALRNARRFTIDLTPRLILCRGKTVDALVESNVSKYLEFKSLDSTVCLGDDGPVKVPCSKSEVFRSKSLGMIEKRQLMKFLQFCNDRRVKSEGKSVDRVNEEGLNQGRSWRGRRTKSRTCTHSKAKMLMRPF